ncbi:TetR/AcrR family transcriptional regulator [Chitinophaga nivalis]|uniref:TetR/AcrR family transcriptional regulator n=1 Tax=Chitinophaga nivalis TaxID=2991709 RepID=A0ABT3IMA0_9BACT|nr:TetR/AcrR family transcriptional regulator [Chitinophaga nivalis]MCW3465204.1 TetR/AcrR family transcriptional regulator [Chitinophaga nivalis]MCW3485104.1 TetR/AcrR family transcriptional regulator [Chitinophaga nivalis]
MARNKAFNPTEKLEKARNLFWKKGYHATSMEDLVSEMKVNRGSIYDTYGDKQQLFMESLRSYALETHSEYRRAALGERSPLKAIEKIIRKAVARSFEQQKVCMVVKSSFEMAVHDDALKQLLQQLTTALVEIFEDLIRQAIAAGEIDAKKDARQTALFLTGAFAGLWQMQTLFDDRKMIEQMAKGMIDILQ